MTISFDKTKLTKSLAKREVLAPFLERAFETFDDPWTFDYKAKETDTAWHPSGHCTPPVSDLYASVVAAGWLDFMDKAPSELLPPPPSNVSGSLRKSFMVGHYWHQLIQHVVVEKVGFAKPEAIERKGERIWARLWDEPGMITPPKPYHWAAGSGDFAPLKTPKWQGVVDIKTMSSHQFKQGQIPEWAADKYKCQLNIYMDLFDEERGMILAVNKDAPHDFKEFHFERDQTLIDSIYRKWQFVSECLDSKVAPTEKDDEEYVIDI